jgi:hypothetical protein
MPKPFVEMDPELARKAVEGYTNELAPERAKLDAFYRQFDCPQCKGTALHQEYVPKHAFGDPDIIVPRALLRCEFCRVLFDPHSGLIVERGATGLVPVDVPMRGPRT